MIMLDKARTSIWIKIGASVLAFVFVVGIGGNIFIAGAGGIGDLFKSMFQGTSGSSEDTQTQAAIIQLKQKLKDNPKDVKSLVDLGNAYYDSGKYQNAITNYQKSLDIDSKNYDVMTDMGAAYNSLGQADKALEIFKQVTAAKPDHAMAWLNQGVVYKAKNDTANMRFAWERFLAVQPTGAQADSVRAELANATTSSAASSAK